MKRRIVGAAIGAALALAAVAPAIASPGSVSLQAGGCYGSGQSTLSYPSGPARTIACGGSLRYLSATIIRQDGVTFTLPGAWFSGNPVFANTGVISPVAVVAATHAVQFITSFDGYYGTNTW